MVSASLKIANIHHTIENGVFKRVDIQKYMETWITSDIDQPKEIKWRIEAAYTSFIKSKKIV